VVSGPGLVNLQDFLRAHRGVAVPSWLSDEMVAGDAAAAISSAALDERDAICAEASSLCTSTAWKREIMR
jgi:glucokinase